MTNQDSFFFDDPDGQEALFNRLDFETRVIIELDDPEKTDGMSRGLYYALAEFDALNRYVGSLSLGIMNSIERFDNFMGAKPVAENVLRTLESAGAENFYDAK